jgi:hypothetical protein
VAMRGDIWTLMCEAWGLFGEQRDLVMSAYGAKITVSASVWGPWAIHKALVDVGDVSSKRVVEMEGMWELTHWRTGWRVACDQWRECLALLAKMLNKLGGWESDDFGALPLSKARPVIARWWAFNTLDDGEGWG